jgi:hypothetical protein
VSGDRRLSLREFDQLCTAFMQLSGMRDPHTRDMYVDLLGGELGSTLSFSRYQDPGHDVGAMLSTCLAHHGGIRKLADVVRPFHRDSMPMHALDELIEVLLPEEFLRPEERDDLVAVLAHIEQERLVNAFRYAAPPAAQSMAVDPADPEELVRQLESWIGGADSAAPLLVFVDYLAHQLDAIRNAEQHRWIDKVGARRNVPASRLRHLCASTEARLDESQTLYFVVQLQPDGVDPDRYLTSAWLQRPRSIEEPLYRNDEPLHLEEIIDLLPELLSTAHTLVNTGGGIEMTVEFILPRSLIDLAVDQWQVDKVFPHALSTKYSVMIRSMDRLRRADLHGEWQKKWRRLKVDGHQPQPGSVMWLSRRGSPAPETLHKTLLQDESTVALAMSFPPEPSAGLKTDEITAALYAGIPIIIWIRDDRLGPRFENVLREMLDGHGLRELPALLLRLRREPDEETSLGSNITLIWDDHDRIPESFTRNTRLQAPQRQ